MDILITESITMETANRVLQEMLTKRDTDKRKDIVVYINSHGGELEAGYAIYEMLKCSERKIITCGVGEIYSCALILFLAGAERYAINSTKFMIHEARHIHEDDPSLTTKEYEKYLKEIQGDTKGYFDLIAKNTRLTTQQIKKHIQKAANGDWNFDVTLAKKLDIVTKIGMPF